MQFLERTAQILKIFGLNRVDTGKHHRLDLFESGDGLGTGTRTLGDGIAHLDFGAVFDAGNDISYIARRKRLSGDHVELEHPNLLRIVFFARVHELHMVASLDGAVDDFEIGDDASEGIENGVKNERLQGSIRVALRSRNALDDGFQNVFHAHAGLAAGADNLLAFASEQLYDFVFHHVEHG